jgi:hypothetical protein
MVDRDSPCRRFTKCSANRAMTVAWNSTHTVVENDGSAAVRTVPKTARGTLKVIKRNGNCAAHGAQATRGLGHGGAL